jgi:hypothetical protein
MKKSFKKYEALGLPGGPNQLKRFTNGFIISERGQWDYPGQPTAVPTPTGKITMQGVKNNLVGIDNLGNMQYMTPGNEYQFQGDMVYEIPQAKKGGSKKPSKKYSRSLMAKNRLFTKNALFEKRKSVKNKIFDPYSPYFQPGGETYNQLPSRYGDALKNFVYPEVVDSSEETGYDAALGIIKQNPNDPIANVNNPWWYEHELMHHLQNQAGGMSTYGAVGLRPNPYVASDEAIGSYYDRRGSEFQTELNRILKENPDISEEEAYARAEEDLYNNPTTTEGEARNYEGYIEAGNPSIFPKKQQDGGSLPPEVSVSYLPEGERSYYDPRIDTIYLDPNASEEELNHEMAHAWQNRQDGFRSDPYSPKLRPSTAASDEQAATYFNRKGDDVDRYINNLKTIAPELGGHTWNKDLDRFIPEQLKYDKVIDPLMYNDPSTLEGEAEYMSQVYGRPPLGIKQDGGIILDLTEDQINEYKKGGYIVEDISVPSLTKASYGYSVGDLIRKQDGGSVSGTQGLTDDFSERLTQFILDAKSQGIDLGVGSGYRSYEKQKKLWEQALKKYGSPEKARKWVAPPGSSFHNKGLAVDLNSNGQFLGKDANSKATEWAHANAKKYGLHFRMGHEPWHIEPIEKSKSNNENDEIYGDTPNKMSQEEYEQMIANKDLEFELKQKELEERERKLHDDDYSNWEPSKKEIVDPQEEILNAYAKIIAPSNQNLFELYNANLHGKMKRGGIVMELTDKEIDRYRKGGYIIEEMPKAQDGIQVSPSIWSDYQPKGPVIEDSTPEIEKIISQSVVKEKPLVLNSNQEKSFEEAHSEARNELGPNQIFEYNGRKFGTNNPGENFNPDEKTLEKANLNTNAVKENIYNQNKDLNDPYKSKNTVKLQEKEYEDWDKVKQKQNEINKSSNADKIIKYKSFDNSDKNYVIVDKQKGLLHVYKPGDEKPLFSAAVDLGANIGDAQTVTKVKDTNGDGIIDAQEAQIAKADFSLGNKTTGAGRYHISTIDPKGYGGLPLFNMMTDSQYEKYLKTGDINQVATSLHKGYIADDNSRVSNGCIRCNKTTLDNLVKYLENSSEVYILPEDKNNEFVYENGKINLKIKNKSNFYTYKNNGNIYKKENNNWYVAPKIGSSFTKIKEESRIKLLNKDATNAGYNFYIDSYGKVQKGQGVNKGSSLNYIPIKAKLNEEKFKNDKFTFFDFNDESELKNVKLFAKSLEDNKQKIMKAAKINGDTYNDIAKITFGIFGTESNFADTHMPHENLAKAIKKLIAPSSSSSPDYYSKYYIYGAKGDSRSVGMTQVRWNYLNDDEKKALKEVGINSNKDFMDPTKSAMGTAVVLGIRYNQQLTDTQKKDIWKYLPKKWNIRDNYADRVKSNSKYITIEQKNLKDKSIIANTNNEIYTYRGNKNAKYKKDKFGNWYINSGNKTNNQFVKINDPKGNRTKELNTYAVKLKKFIK